jgi:hypothetical protein
VTNYSRTAYGAANPNAGYPANGDVAAWGGHSWPQGVPASLLGATNYTNKTNGQVLRVTMRKELVPLWQLIFELCDTKYHYPIYSKGPSDGKPWGPWGYENRPISGTQRASGHSVAVSVDINAPYNPYSYTFQSNMPPAMVHDMESLGQYWGGRYTGQKYDAMHFGFCRKPGTVAAYITRARNLLGQTIVVTPPKPPVAKPPVAKPPVAKPPAPAMKPYTPPPSTAWPLPKGHYFGLKSGPAVSHGGGKASDVPWVRWIQTRMNQLGYGGGHIKVDGDYGPTTKSAVALWQKARHASTTSRPGEVWSDDFAHLRADR